MRPIHVNRYTPLKFNSRFLLETIIFRFHVKLWGCNSGFVWSSQNVGTKVIGFHICMSQIRAQDCIQKKAWGLFLTTDIPFFRYAKNPSPNYNQLPKPLPNPLNSRGEIRQSFSHHLSRESQTSVDSLQLLLTPHWKSPARPKMGRILEAATENQDFFVRKIHHSYQVS